jgi:hypothetical protein
MKKNKLLFVVLITVFLSSYASAEDWWDVKTPGRESAESAHPVQDWWNDVKAPEPTKKAVEPKPPVQAKRTVTARKTGEPAHPVQDWWKDAKAPEPTKKAVEPKPPVQAKRIVTARKTVEPKHPIQDWWNVPVFSNESAEPIHPIRVWWSSNTLIDEVVLRKEFNAVLTRSANNQYVLSYKDGELSATTVQGILDEMRRNNFYPVSINTVRDNADLIPAEHVSEKALSEIKQDIHSFYLNPTQAMFNVLDEKYRTYNRTGGDSGKAIAESIYQAVYVFSPDLADRLGRSQR